MSTCSGNCESCSSTCERKDMIEKTNEFSRTDLKAQMIHRCHGAGLSVEFLRYFIKSHLHRVLSSS